jgi:RNA polymerase sigma-70 factor (ECF subfamily)
LAADLVPFSDNASSPLNLSAEPGVQGFASASDAMQSHAEERALLKAIAGGDAKALERLFARAQTRVFRFLMRIVKSQAIAEELLNEVFLSVWQDAHCYEGRSEPLTWMLSIAHNKAISAMRKKTEMLGIADDVARDLAVDDDAPDIAVQKQDKSAKMRACIAELSPNHRTILDLVYYQEQSVAEVAEILGIPEATVKTRMFYARKKLSELLLERGIDRGWP